MRKNWLILLLTLPLVFEVTAQQPIIDSIEKELKNSIPDSVRAFGMMRIAINYEGIDTAKAAKAYKDAIAFAVGKKLYFWAGRIYDNQSVLLITRGLYAMARASLDSAMYYLDNSHHPDAIILLAKLYKDEGNIAKARTTLQRGLSINPNEGSLKRMLESIDHPVPEAVAR